MIAVIIVIAWLGGAVLFALGLGRVIRHRDTEIPNGDKK